MLARLAYAAIVGIVVFLLVVLIFPLLTLPAYPWAALLGVLAGIAVFFGGRL